MDLQERMIYFIKWSLIELSCKNNNYKVNNNNASYSKIQNIIISNNYNIDYSITYLAKEIIDTNVIQSTIHLINKLSNDSNDTKNILKEDLFQYIVSYIGLQINNLTETNTSYFLSKFNEILFN